MSKKSKAPGDFADRAYFYLWELLTEDEKAQLKAIGGLPHDWRPDLREEPTRAQQLEGARELERLARMRPGLIGTWPQRLIDRVEPEKEGE